ncbi:MAG TPA: heparan-alpha-glucosaminide N-acetyltransferase domain-containing protein [Bryobacteraceae bacterium]|nr:heparan-alpha-glucosaminide N-acetyltransferase domain-containing protein [Bryobacteraceae bacterium]HPU72285.1 heparan-alpha-glucosaminide N-acetyltransferase domain-containing protein [Bryobacteraceae bacterium]
MASATKSKAGRLAFIDWTRGLGALIMLQGHAFHAFTKPELRDSGPYAISQFVGGLPPAVFLFLVGVTLAFLMDSSERKGLRPAQRVVTALRRSGYLFTIAFLFRLQLWLFGLPHSRWTDLLKVDILNAMGFAVAVMSVMAVFSTADRVRLCAVLGLAIAAASPLVSQLNWSWAPEVVKHYIAPDYLAFAFFPWASFVAFGMSAGSILRLTKRENYDHVMQWAAVLGLVLVFGGQQLSNLPFSLYSKSEFWLDSPWLVLMKLGVLLLIVSFAYLWTKHSEARWSWVRQFGMTSLLVYWVHIELVYGRWFWFWKENLTIGQTAIAAVVLIVLMLILSTARTQWKNWRLLGFSLGWYFWRELRQSD